MDKKVCNPNFVVKPSKGDPVPISIKGTAGIDANVSKLLDAITAAILGQIKSAGPGSKINVSYDCPTCGKKRKILKINSDPGDINKLLKILQSTLRSDYTLEQVQEGIARAAALDTLNCTVGGPHQLKIVVVQLG